MATEPKQETPIEHECSHCQRKVTTGWARGQFWFCGEDCFQASRDRFAEFPP